MVNKLQSYHIITFGCQMNEYDSEVMAGLLEQMGYQAAPRPEDADIVLVNTCCVRQSAENKILGLIGRLRKYKKARPHMVIGIGGCMTQQKETAQKLKERFPHLDFIFGTHNVHELPDLINQSLTKKKRLLAWHPESAGIPEGLPVKRNSGIKAWVPIMLGCNNFCTYCIVPYVRGRERSRRPEQIVQEVRNLISQGYKEVTLLGQNVNSYGQDLDSGINFAGLLRLLAEETNIPRLRFVTSHPKDFSPELIEVMKTYPAICEHIHLPVQAGSNKVLQEMNRKYSREYYLALAEKIYREIPGVAITTDIMVGFPGETEEDFAQTMDIVRKVRFANAYMFVYNPRRGTPAAERSDQVPDEIKVERIKQLVETQNRITLELNQAEVGRVHEVLVEGTSKSNPGVLSGHTRTNKTVLLEGQHIAPGQIIQIKITRGTLTYLEGKPVAGF
nr:tRNA (N6-isopentenyl adenosine(37)-C2)-methylthiotransferase MiaB [Desulfurispora thermophila]